MAQKNRSGIWIAVIGGIVAVAVALVQFHPWNTEHPEMVKHPTSNPVIAGTVVDEDNNKGVPLAQISLVGINDIHYSEGDGNFRINIKDTTLSAVHLRVSAKGYRVFDHSFDLPNDGIIVKLQKQ